MNKKILGVLIGIVIIAILSVVYYYQNSNEINDYNEIEKNNLEDGFLVWSERPVRWEDFWGEPQTGRFGAQINAFAKLDLDLNYLKYESGVCEYEVTDVDVITVMDKTKSWKNTLPMEYDTEYGIIHEQGHFDITEIHARLMEKKIKAELVGLKFSCIITDGKINDGLTSKDATDRALALTSDISKSHVEFEDTYENETDHSLNVVAQITWNERIQEWLLETQDIRD